MDSSCDGCRDITTAVTSNHQRCLEHLIRSNANVNELTYGHRSALHIAAENGYIECLQILLDNDANVHCRDKRHWTPLHFAARSGLEASIALLLEYGANIEARTMDGLTALDVARRYGNHHVTHLLEPKSTGSRSAPAVVDYEPLEITVPNKGSVSTAASRKNQIDSHANNGSRSRNGNARDIGVTPFEDGCNTTRTRTHSASKISQTSLETLQKENEDLRHQVVAMRTEFDSVKSRVQERTDKECQCHHMQPGKSQIEECTGVLVNGASGQLVCPDMISKEYGSPAAQSLFSSSNAKLFQETLDPDPVIDHMWSSRALKESQMQDLRALPTVIRKADSLWSLMKKGTRYRDAVAKALVNTNQRSLAVELSLV